LEWVGLVGSSWFYSTGLIGLMPSFRYDVNITIMKLSPNRSVVYDRWEDFLALPKPRRLARLAGPPLMSQPQEASLRWFSNLDLVLGRGRWQTQATNTANRTTQTLSHFRKIGTSFR
jgi:hypothetical protein